MKNNELWYTFISHAERKGMSVLRQGAADVEFERTINLRVKETDRKFRGVVSFRCGDVRSLLANVSADGRLVGDRLYCVLDTDADGRPHHADVFVTVPRPGNDVTPKAAFRRQRERLMVLLRHDFVAAESFRNGNLAKTSQ